MRYHSQRCEESEIVYEWHRKPSSEMLRLAKHDKIHSLLRAFESSGEQIIHHQRCNESGDAKILLGIVVVHVQPKFITTAD